MAFVAAGWDVTALSCRHILTVLMQRRGDYGYDAPVVTARLPAIADSPGRSPYDRR